MGFPNDLEIPQSWWQRNRINIGICVMNGFDEVKPYEAPKHKNHGDLLAAYLMAVHTFDLDMVDYYEWLLMIDQANEDMLLHRLVTPDKPHWPVYLRFRG